jgi:hypothetical protein
VLRDGKKLDIPDFIERHGIEVLKEDEWDGPGSWAGPMKVDRALSLERSHGTTPATSSRTPKASYRPAASMTRCQGKDWRDFREHYEPGSTARCPASPVPKYAGTLGTPSVSLAVHQE